MSKSLGNGIDPLEVIDKYGADALRLTLMTGNAPGNDMRFYWERVESSRNFANKVWNASRFIMMNLEKAEVPSSMDLANLTAAEGNGFCASSMMWQKTLPITWKNLNWVLLYRKYMTLSGKNSVTGTSRW